MILKILVLGVVLFVTYSLFKKKDAGKVEGKTSSKDAPVEMVKCETCGTFTEKEAGYKVKLYEDHYIFCSEECRKKFIDEKSSGEQS